MTIREFADRIGVSTGTVSRAINGRYGVGAATREMVLKKMAELQFQPSRAAAFLATGRARSLAVWCAGLDSPYSARVLAALEHEMERHDYDLVVADVCRKRYDQDRLAKLGRWPVDGILVLDGEGWLDDLVESRRLSGLPVVSMGVHPGTRTDQVLIDVGHGVAQAVAHLAQSGCRRVAYMAPRDTCAQETGLSRRYDCYCASMREAGLEIELIPFDYTYRPVTARAIMDHVRRKGCPDAIVCYNDDTAIGAHRGLRDSGISVPEHALLVGCDGIEEAAYMDPPLSTIVAPVEQMCAKAWEFLESRSREPEAPLRREVLQGEFLARESSRRPEKAMTQSRVETASRA